MSTPDDPNRRDHMPSRDPALRIGTWMLASAWVLVIIVLALGFELLGIGADNPNRRIASTDTGDAVEVALARNRAGHYVANGLINTAPARMLLDTGATDVSIPADLAERIGLARGRPVQARTANGVRTVYVTWLDTVAIGDIVVADVRANINPGLDGNEVLLGMSVLGELELIQRHGVLTLRQPKP